MVAVSADSSVATQKKCGRFYYSDSESELKTLEVLAMLGFNCFMLGLCAPSDFKLAHFPYNPVDAMLESLFESCHLNKGVYVISQSANK